MDFLSSVPSKNRTNGKLVRCQHCPRNGEAKNDVCRLDKSGDRLDNNLVTGQ